MSSGQWDTLLVYLLVKSSWFASACSAAISSGVFFLRFSPLSAPAPGPKPIFSSCFFFSSASFSSLFLMPYCQSKMSSVLSRCSRSCNNNNNNILCLEFPGAFLLVPLPFFDVSPLDALQLLSKRPNALFQVVPSFLSLRELVPRRRPCLRENDKQHNEGNC